MLNSMSPAPCFGNLPPYLDMYGYDWSGEFSDGQPYESNAFFPVEVWGQSYGESKNLWPWLLGLAVLLILLADSKD